MIQISDRLSLTMIINGQPLLLDRVNVLSALQISTSVLLSVPSLYFKYVDTVEWIIKNKVFFDSSLIEVSITRAGQKAPTAYRFRLNSFKEEMTDGAVAYEVDAYYDAPVYWNGSTNASFSGTSSEALAYIANECDIEKTDITQTADSQLWIPHNKRYHQWARFIADRGFSSESSCMKLAFDPIKGLLYKDVFKETPATARFGMAVTQSGIIPVTSYKPKVSSGVQNNAEGYGSTFIEQLPLEDIKTRRHERLDVPVQGNKQLVISNAVRNKTQAGKVRIGYIDPGNSNENYERGMYQNIRGSYLFSLGVTVLTPSSTYVSLLDDVEFFIPKDQTYVKPYSSKYKVMSKSIILNGIDYYELFDLSSITLNDSYRDGLKESPGPLTSEG
jgi:hypothetical protein